MKKPTSPLGLVGLYFIQREKPGFHGQIAAEVPGPFVSADVFSWGAHEPVAVRVFNVDDVRAFDFYRTKRAFDVAVAEVDAVNARKTSA